MKGRSPLLFSLACLLAWTSICLGQAPGAPAIGVAESYRPLSTQQKTSSPELSAYARAVVRIESHGVSATIIWTGPGKSYLLTCAHGHTGQARHKPMTVDVPIGGPINRENRATIRLIDIDYAADLALIEFGVGPLPSCCPVALRGHPVSKETLSVGFDEMKWPAVQRPTHVLTAYTWTQERPWHGRSGGALIDPTGVLVGVCHGYTGPTAPDKAHFREVHPAGQGMYVSHETICRFLEKQGWDLGSAPRHEPPRPPGAGRVPAPVPRSAPSCPT